MQNLSIFEGAVDTISFTLRAGKHRESALVVAGFRANEKLSQLFRFDVDVVVDPDAIPSLDDTLGEDAEFRILRDDQPVRVVRGIVEEVTPRRSTDRQRLITLKIVPKLAELQYTADTKIFQDLPVHEIVAELVKPHNIELEWRLDHRPEARAYRVQKDETDYEFFCRILADAGISFHFASDEAKVMLVNSPKGYDPIDGGPELPYRETGGAVTVDHVGSIARARGLRPGSIVMRDYDFKKSRGDLTARVEVEAPHTAESAPKREVFLFPGDYADATESGKTLAAIRLEESRSPAIAFHGQSSCIRLQVGRKFTVEQHLDDSFNQELLVTELRSSGQRSGILADTGRDGNAPGFTCTFVGVPSKTRVRPERPALPYAPSESARVVGPEKGTPFVDEFGRVKVQFFWDREGKWDEKSSCWLRVMTPAAAADRGIWFPPRVGDEVIVHYLNGDIDRPYVAGAIYNAQEPQPQGLPNDSSKSTIKTLTIPGGKGFNELTFQDRAGQEEIFMHAQKDRKTVVLHNHSETVGANQTSTVGANQSITVGANRTVTVGANETITVTAVRSERVKATEDVTVHKGRKHTVLEGDDVLTLPQSNRTVNIENGSLTHNVKYIDRTEADYIQEHARFEISAVGDKKVDLTQGAAHYTMEKEEILVACPSGSMALAGDKLNVQAVSEISIACGKASITLKADGTIELSAATKIVSSVAGSSVAVDPKKTAVAGASVEVNAVGQAKIQGAIVKIN